MPRTNVLGTTAPPGSGAQRCAQAGKREHRTDSTSRPATATATGARRRRRPEDAIQRAVFQHLRARAAPGVLAFHVPNGGYRKPVEAAIMKGLGVAPGVADVLLFRPGACPHCCSARLEGFALELKSDGGRPSEAQLDFMARFAAAGGHTCIAEGLDRALAVLEAWVLLRGRAS